MPAAGPNPRRSAASTRPSAADLAAAYGRTVPDVLAARLKILFVGINPSLYSAAVGHHFARPGNRFWPALHRSGITPRQMSPAEDQQLVAFGCGITNFVKRATARADELVGDELVRGARILAGQIRRRQIRCVAVLGVTAYRQAFARRQAVVGHQDARLGGAAVWVLPNPSGLNAHYQLGDLAALLRRLRKFVDAV